ncbi:hypothetical protein LWI29_020264 [Acer saccharum]|uniref:Glycerol-3-phosphate dehydrogenase NAD-dependent C-terminal domain-containing protein n=1 Tax=Acer saccharum TaxID=4024 RepID=A0AA39W8P0_ACESA|nr:hypothetical protein LWI29_020264 [Acer saccharum]
MFPPLVFLRTGAKPTTITGLSGTGDIMFTCFVNLSRNRTVGVRLGSGEKLDDILSSMNQKYNIKMPVLTACSCSDHGQRTDPRESCSRIDESPSASSLSCLKCQVAEGVSTAGAVIALAQKYNVKMPVLTAVARIIDNELTPKKAVLELMSLPQLSLELLGS